MLLFCPSCSNMLIITKIPANECTPSEQENAGKNRFECRTCPYQMVLDRAYFERREFEAPRTDDVLGGAGVWEDVDKTDVQCAREKCDSREAFFRQVQTRSADEPMTNLYRCVKCLHEWREG